MNWITNHWLEITAAVTSCVTAASLIVKLTKTPKDDEFLAKVIKFLNIIALNPKK
jgi:preprotein translocase subunit Sss1